MVIRLDIDLPLWDLTTFLGRVLHFVWITDPRTCLKTNNELYAAKHLVELFREENEPPETTYHDVIAAKQMYESAFHPDSHELQNVFGRMSFQLPGNLITTALLLTFYKTTKSVLFGQWFNQSFNACVNYTNRNAKAAISQTQLVEAYFSATCAAVSTAVGLKMLLAKGPAILQRFVPFGAVIASHCVNTPLMRQAEIREGVDLVDSHGKVVVKSKYAAKKGIMQVVCCRIVLTAPGMTILPVIMANLERGRVLRAFPILAAPVQIVLLAGFLTVMVPVACAIFPQKCAVSPDELKSFEAELYEQLVDKYGANALPDYLYFNKGL